MKDVVIVNKIGCDHLDSSRNNQDYFFVSNSKKVKMVFDGCSGCKNSEVGAILFSNFFSEIKEEKRDNLELFEENIELVFSRLLNLSDDVNFLLEHYCFTIIAVFETETEFVVKYIGDGYIITQKGDDIEYIKLEDGQVNGYPKYYIYNYIPAEFLIDYKDGIQIQTLNFPKAEYQNIGVSTDGLQYVDNLDWTEQNKLKQLLLSRKEGKIKMLINRNREHLHDDFTLCF